MSILEELNLSNQPTKLTENQRQIIQEEFNSIPKERIENIGEYAFLTQKYYTWKGIEEQLKLGNKIIYYADYRNVPEGYESKICKLRIEE